MGNRVELYLALALLVAVAVPQAGSKALHGTCVDDTDCPKGAECTVPVGVNNVTDEDPRKCECKKELREYEAGTRCGPVGRECNTDKDCVHDVNTTCTTDRVDGKKRCLCGSGNAPGVLPECIRAALLQPCRSDEECPVNAQCSALGDGKDKVCSCMKNFTSKRNITCEPNSAGRAAMMSVAMLFMYVSLTTIL